MKFHFLPLAALATFRLALAAQPTELVAPFSATAMEFPESVAVDREGNSYLSMVATSTIKKVTPDGTQSVLAKLDDSCVHGLKFDGVGSLFVAGGRGIWRVMLDGAANLFCPMTPGSLNDLALDPIGNIYTSYHPDETTSAIWKIDVMGLARQWSASPLLQAKKSFMPACVAVNGLVVDRMNKFLYASVTSAGRIVEFKINPDGSAGAARIVVENDALIGADGLALDERGNLYVAVNLQNRISKVTLDGKICDVAVGGQLSFPTSVAFDHRNGRSTLYVCNNGNFFFGNTTHDQALLRIANPDPARLIQVSTRAQVGTGGDILISGFVVEGTSSKTVLIRAVGPTLASFGLAGALVDPRLEVFSASQTTAPLYSNDNWNGDAALSTAAANSGAFPLASAASKDAALLATLAPGSYTARVSGVGDATGVALLEIYEVP